MAFDPVAKEKHLITEHIKRSQEQVAAAVRRISETVIKDRLVKPEEIDFDTNNKQLFFHIKKDPVDHFLHPHALGQIAAKVKLPMQYVNMLNVVEPAWRSHLLSVNLNTLLHNTEFIKRGGEPMKFLLRFVGDELRGFMSRSFGRHLASIPTLRAFLEAVREVEALPCDASVSPVRSSLSAYIPVVYEPVKTHPIAIGVRWANSDFAAGKLTVALTVLHVRGGTSMILSEEFSKVHLGAIIQESDIEMSADTEAKEVDAVASAIKDVVIGQLKPESIQKLLGAIERAHEAKVEWGKLKGLLRKFLYEEELKTVESIARGERGGHVDLPSPGTGPDGEPLPTKWWASLTLSWVADSLQDLDRKADLQQEAGKLLGNG